MLTQEDLNNIKKCITIIREKKFGSIFKKTILHLLKIKAKNTRLSNVPTQQEKSFFLAKIYVVYAHNKREYNKCL